MTRVYGDDDVDLGVAQYRNAAVIGYAEPAAAHALCLRDSGVDVRVGLEPADPLRDRAIGDGLRVVPPLEACEEADLVVLATDDAAEVREELADLLVPGDAIVLVDDAALIATRPEGVDIVRIASWGDGAAVRREFSRGRGVPAFAAVVHEESDRGWPLALAYARAIGATKAGVVRVSEAELQTLRDVGTSRLEAGLLSLVRGSFDASVAAGCTPESAYLQSVHGLRALVSRLVGGELDGRLAALGVPSGDTPERRPNGSDPLPAAGDFIRSLMDWEREEPR